VRLTVEVLAPHLTSVHAVFSVNVYQAGVGIAIARDPIHRPGWPQVAHPAPTLGEKIKAPGRGRVTNTGTRSFPCYVRSSVKTLVRCGLAPGERCSCRAGSWPRSRRYCRRNRGSRDDNICACIRSQRRCFFVHASIYLELTGSSCSLDHLANASDLWQHAAKELLVSKTWISRSSPTRGLFLEGSLPAPRPRSLD